LVGSCVLDSTGSEQGQVVGSCERSNEPWGSQKNEGNLLTNWVTTSMSVCSVELTVCTEFLVPSWFTLWRYTTAATLYGGLKFCGMVVHDESMQIYEVFQPIRESRNIILRVIFPMFGPCEW